VSRASTRNGVAYCSIGFSKLNSAAHGFLYLRFNRQLAMSPARVEAKIALEALWENV
jgi:hypothetical protein